MKVIKITFNPFQENTFLLVADNNDAIVVDPGMFSPEEHMAFDNYISSNKTYLILKLKLTILDLKLFQWWILLLKLKLFYFLMYFFFKLFPGQNYNIFERFSLAYFSCPLKGSIIV